DSDHGAPEGSGPRGGGHYACAPTRSNVSSATRVPGAPKTTYRSRTPVVSAAGAVTRAQTYGPFVAGTDSVATTWPRTGSSTRNVSVPGPSAAWVTRAPTARTP